MSCAQLVAELSVDDDVSGVFSIDEILSGPQIESESSGAWSPASQTFVLGM